MAASPPGPAPSISGTRAAGEPSAAARGATATTRPREEQLRRTAVRLFREHGYDGTSMQDLAEALGMRRGSLYHYIASKEDLLFAIVEAAMARFRDEVSPILERSEAPAIRLRDAVAAHLRIAADEPDELTLVQVELKALAPDRGARIVAERDAYEHEWRSFVRSGMSDGSFDCDDERTAVFMILSTCNWFSQWYHPSGPLGVDEFAERFTTLFLRALGAAGSGER